MGQIAYPRMRGVDVFPTEISGQKVICLRDPLNLSGKILFIPIHAYFILSLFDGRHSVTDVQAEFMRQFGELIYRDKIEQLVAQLDENFLLESERFREAERQLIDSFKASPVRPMALAGESYAQDGEELRKTISSYFDAPDGPDGTAFELEGTMAGAIAPHIDYGRGGPTYAWAHGALQESCNADLFVILGTSHTPMKKLFALTRKGFETPYGVVETDREFVSELEGDDLYEDEWVHKTEHSIELQLVFLRALWRKKDPFRIVPILCGSFHEAIANRCSPADLPGVEAFVQSLKRAMNRAGRRVCLIASADLAHMGLRFGDTEPLTRFSLKNLEEEDLALLERAGRVDAEDFFRTVSRDGDRRRICGLAPIYILLRLLEGGRGKLLKYSQAFDPSSQSVVSFAGMAFHFPSAAGPGKI
ncbi:MAG TPA: AmmeMemoRadiSam system protein B [Thermodesulfobacteriota bacterium]|nr:AmmeMemoRadiSam system protein B [Thermodesulfobacteriota bacterium]